MSVHNVSSKMDQYRQGDTVLVARKSNDTCPVAMLEKYVTAANSPPSSSELHIFRGVTTLEKGNAYVPQAVYYTRMREVSSLN